MKHALDFPPYSPRYANLLQQELRQQLAQVSEQVEKDLATWKPTGWNNQTPPAKLLWKQTRLEGYWDWSSVYESGSLLFGAPRNGVFPVWFHTSGCLNAWELRRTARYENGVITLDRLVQEYVSEIYNRLYTIRVGGKDYLVPDLYVAKFERGLSSDGKKINERMILSYAYQRPRADGQPRWLVLLKATVLVKREIISEGLLVYGIPTQ